MTSQISYPRILGATVLLITLTFAITYLSARDDSVAGTDAEVVSNAAVPIREGVNPADEKGALNVIMDALKTRVGSQALLDTGASILDTGVVYIPGRVNQQYAAVAFDGTNFLVVWCDGRNSSEYDLYGARVDQAGRLLDSTRIAISITPEGAYLPSVAFDGTNYFVVWNEWGDIYGARVTRDGVVVDSAGIVISGMYWDMVPSVAFDGTNYLVVWGTEQTTTIRDVYGARVTQSGTVLDTVPIPISTTVNSQWRPSVAFDGTNFLVVWEDSRSGTASDIYGARVSPAGVVLDPDGIPISRVANSPSVAFDGVNYLVVWKQYIGSVTDIYGARLTRDGVVLDPGGIAISIASGDQDEPSVAFDGINYLAVWQSSTGNDIYGARVSPSGVLLDSTDIAISTAAYWQWRPSVAFGTADYLVVWEDSRSGLCFNTYGARVTRSGAVRDSAGIMIGGMSVANSQDVPAAACDGTNYLVAWTDSRSGARSDIYGIRVSESGAIVDTAAIAISTATDSQTEPSVTFDGLNYLIAWADRRNGSYDIYGARVSRSGMILDPNGIAISTAANSQNAPSVCFNGTNFLVAWEDQRNAASWDIYGARVTSDGIVLDPAGIAISNEPYNQYAPSVASNGTDNLVVWCDYRCGWNYDIYGARVSRTGAVLDPVGFAVSADAAAQGLPAVAFDGINYFTVWQDQRNGSHYDIYGARVDQGGVVLDPDGIPVIRGANNQFTPAVTFDGTNYLLAWCEDRSGATTDLYGAWVNTVGVLVDSFVLSTQTGNQRSPALAHGAGSQCLATYAGWCDSINQHLVDTMRIWGKFLPSVGIEEDALRLTPDALCLEIHPNPCRTKICLQIAKSIEQKAERIEIKIFDICGKLIKEEKLTDFKGEAIISLKGMSAGVYFIKVKIEDKEFIEKIVVTK